MPRDPLAAVLANCIGLIHWSQPFFLEIKLKAVIFCTENKENICFVYEI